MLAQGSVRVILAFFPAMAVPTRYVGMSCGASNVPGTLHGLTAPVDPFLEPAHVVV